MKKRNTSHAIVTALITSTDAVEALKVIYELKHENDPNFNYSSIALKSNLTRSFVRQGLLGMKALSLNSFMAIISGMSLQEDWEDYLLKSFELSVARELKSQNRIKKAEKDLKSLKTLLRKQRGSVDKFFSSLLWPRIYASLGTESRGASLAEILRRSKIRSEDAARIMDELIANGVMRKENDRYLPIIDHIDLGQSHFFKRFFKFNHSLLGEKAEMNFNSETEIYFSSVTCVDARALPQIKKGFKEVLMKFIDMNEDAEGSTTVTIVAGMFEN